MIRVNPTIPKPSVRLIKNPAQAANVSAKERFCQPGSGTETAVGVELQLNGLRRRLRLERRQPLF